MVSLLTYSFFFLSQRHSLHFPIFHSNRISHYHNSTHTTPYHTTITEMIIHLHINPQPPTPSNNPHPHQFPTKYTKNTLRINTSQFTDENGYSQVMAALPSSPPLPHSTVLWLSTYSILAPMFSRILVARGISCLTTSSQYRSLFLLSIPRIVHSGVSRSLFRPIRLFSETTGNERCSLRYV